MRTALYLSPLRKLCSKIEPVRRLRSFALMTAPARASLMCSTLTIVSSSPSISKAVPVRKSFVEINQVLHREQIAAKSESGDHPDARRSRDADAPVSLRSGKQVRDV